MTDFGLSRRRLLTSSGGLGVLGLAGCLDELTENDEQTAPDDAGGGTEADDGGDGEDADDHDEDSSHDHDDDHEVGHPESAIEVEMVTNDDGEHFAPHVVHVEAGGTVEWVAESGSHDTVAYHPDTHGGQRRIPDDADPWESDLLDDGDAFERTFEVDGVYDYACTPHEEGGMVGTVVVGWPDPDEQPGLEAVADDLPDAAIEQLERYNDRVREALEEGGSHESDDSDGEDDGEDDHDDGHDDHDH